MDVKVGMCMEVYKSEWLGESWKRKLWAIHYRAVREAMDREMHVYAGEDVTCYILIQVPTSSYDNHCWYCCCR